MTEEKNKSTLQIKREFEAAQKATDDEINQKLRKDLVISVMKDGHESDKKHPWDRAQQLFHYVKSGNVPKPGLYHGFKY